MLIIYKFLKKVEYNIKELPNLLIKRRKLIRKLISKKMASINSNVNLKMKLCYYLRN